MKTFALTKALLVKQTRDTSYSIWVLLLPPLLYLVFRLLWPSIAEGGKLLSALSLYIALTIGIMNLPLAYAQMRDEGILRRLAISPIHGLSLPLALVVSSFLMSLIGIALIALEALAFADIPALMLPLFFLASAIALSAFLIGGIALPQLSKDFLTLKNIGNIAFIALFSLSGILFSLPKEWSLIHWVNPAFWINEGITSSLTGALPGPGMFASALALYTMGICLSLLFFRGKQ